MCRADFWASETIWIKRETRGDGLGCEVGNVGSTSEKERTETVEKRQRYDTPKLIRSNGKNWTQNRFWKCVCEDENWGLIPCFSVQGATMYPKSLRMIGRSDDYGIYPPKYSIKRSNSWICKPKPYDQKSGKGISDQFICHSLVIVVLLKAEHIV